MNFVWRSQRPNFGRTLAGMRAEAIKGRVRSHTSLESGLLARTSVTPVMSK
jgi:hypothetical protein